MNRALLRLALLLGVIAWFSPSPFAPAGRSQTSPSKPTPTKPALTGFPFTNEGLSYTVNWPTGLTLGDAQLSATGVPSGWRFEMTLDASIPGFVVKDDYRATSTASLCSESFSKDSTHGSRKNNETVAIDPATSTATRSTVNSDGVSKIAVPDCVRDALTFLFYTRRELGQGRVPVAQEIIFGATYNASLQYEGAETIMVGNKRTVTDKMLCHIKGPASDVQFEAFFDRDAARTPVSIRVPLPLGKFSLEIVR